MLTELNVDLVDELSRSFIISNMKYDRLIMHHNINKLGHMFIEVWQGNTFGFGLFWWPNGISGFYTVKRFNENNPFSITNNISIQTNMINILLKLIYSIKVNSIYKYPWKMYLSLLLHDHFVFWAKKKQTNKFVYHFSLLHSI